MRWLVCVVALVCLQAASQELTDSEIRIFLIQQSIASYPGSCPCPYSTTKNGRRCGGNSAYSKPGGAQPLCFDTDVTNQMVEQFRAQQKANR